MKQELATNDHPPQAPEQILAAKEDTETRVLREAMIRYKWQEADLTKLQAIWSILNDKDE